MRLDNVCDCNTTGHLRRYKIIKDSAEKPDSLNKTLQQIQQILRKNEERKYELKFQTIVRDYLMSRNANRNFMKDFNSGRY